MKLHLPALANAKFKSLSQIARVKTESWANDNLYCPHCNLSLKSYPNNTVAKDLYCPKCKEDFQLKSSCHKFVKSVTGAAYLTTLNSIRSGEHPSLILLNYNKGSSEVKNVEIIHKLAITSRCLVARKPLSKRAKRYPWQGCYYLLTQIPETAKLRIVENGRVIPEKQTSEQWIKIASLLKGGEEKRRWTTDVMKCAEQLYSTFTLQNMYEFEHYLSAAYPRNHNVRAKIRQQLQQLRDSGFIEFIGDGVYRIIPDQKQ